MNQRSCRQAGRQAAWPPSSGVATGRCTSYQHLSRQRWTQKHHKIVFWPERKRPKTETIGTDIDTAPDPGCFVGRTICSHTQHSPRSVAVGAVNGQSLERKESTRELKPPRKQQPFARHNLLEKETCVCACMRVGGILPGIAGVVSQLPRCRNLCSGLCKIPSDLPHANTS